MLLDVEICKKEIYWIQTMAAEKRDENKHKRMISSSSTAAINRVINTWNSVYSNFQIQLLLNYIHSRNNKINLNMFLCS